MDVATETIAAWSAHLGMATADLTPVSLRSQLASGTLPTALRNSSSRTPQARLSIGADSLTHRELGEASSRVAAVLADQGVGRGHVVLLSGRSSINFVICYLAALHTGASVTLANPGYTTAELQSLLKRSNAHIVLCETPADTTDKGAVPTFTFDQVIATASDTAPRPIPELDSADIAMLAYTSGTTGTPKCVPLTHGMLLSSIRSAMLAWQWSADDVLVHALPLFHQHGLSGLHASLLAGCDAHIVPEFEPRELLATVERSKASIVFGVPGIHQRLLALADDELLPLRHARLVTSGSAPLPVAIAQEFLERTGITLLERYGLTESGLNLSNAYEGDRHFGTVGHPLPGVEVDLLDASGKRVPRGSTGEIVVRGPQVFSGYLGDPDATAAAFWPNQWFRTGDLGRWDANGCLAITGRLKELIITGGMNVAPREVEAVLEQFPGIVEAAVAGLPSEQWGEEVTAWVVAEPTVDIEVAAVLAHCRRSLAVFKCPKAVLVIDQLPRNAMGKIVRAQLPGLSSTTPTHTS